MLKKQIKPLIVFVIFLISFPQVAYAYIDPGTGSYIMQTILAAVLGFAFIIKTYWNKIKLVFKNFKHK
ncbi:MAG: hypothetical protein VR67_11500 [Peptococcaceae bacterium BRH_c8a]|nr:MAG: hypothetical protein VR67_11500 [Peptococcaceae bacterium BRH_c8a]